MANTPICCSPPVQSSKIARPFSDQPLVMEDPQRVGLIITHARVNEGETRKVSMDNLTGLSKLKLLRFLLQTTS